MLQVEQLESRLTPSGDVSYPPGWNNGAPQALIPPPTMLTGQVRVFNYATNRATVAPGVQVLVKELTPPTDGRIAWGQNTGADGRYAIPMGADFGTFTITAKLDWKTAETRLVKIEEGATVTNNFMLYISSAELTFPPPDPTKKLL